MKAVRVLEAASRAGVAIDLDGDDLVLRATCPPDPDLLDLITVHKPGIVRLLALLAWTEADWQALYDERAGIMEFDGGLPKSEAEALAAEEIARMRRAADRGSQGTTFNDGGVATLATLATSRTTRDANVAGVAIRPLLRADHA